MDFNLRRILHEMDWMAKTVTVTLLVMGIVSMAVFMERLIAYWRSRRQSRRFAELAATLVAEGNLRRLLERTTDFPVSHLSRMLAPALRTYLAARIDERHSAEAVVELVRREIARQHEDAGLDLRRGLSVLASVGSVAPFVGLLGTVVGIIAAFGKISITGSAGLSSVAGGISEALVVTAFGLAIAIPAVLLFNNLSTKADRIHHGLGSAAGQFLDHIEFRHGLVTMTADKETVDRPRSAIHAEATPDVSIA
jgi:biopolymer transport protein ExbB